MISPFLLYLTVTASVVTIPVSPDTGMSNKNLMQALQQAAAMNGQPVVIDLEFGIYYLSRAESVKKVYYISNTTSQQEDPDPTKHIGLLLSKLKNVTIEGNGSTLLMTGKMTNFVMDECENITFRNINFDYQYPTQTEIKILEEDNNSITAQVHPASVYRIKDGKLEWYGNGWSFSEGIAQAYDPEKDVTWRTWSPMSNLVQTIELEPNKLRMIYSQKPEAGIGLTYQIRDGIRDEVCGFVHKSKNITFQNVNFYFLGNFGVVCQYSENITVDNTRFAPEPGSGRTNAGFADFIQVSGCKGLIDIKNSHFIGAHDDPINIHGTHLKVIDFIEPNKIKVRFMHPQSYGFEAFFPDDEIEFIDSHTLLTVDVAKIKEVESLNPREIILTLDKDCSKDIQKHKDLVVENITWTPDVRITHNFFSRIPTRGLLVTTRGKVLIENNTFHRMQMSGILIANDALSWYESGKVKDVTIRNNYFIECGSPVIYIEPENQIHQEAVHRNILIEDNKFKIKDGQDTVIQAKSVYGLTIRNNLLLDVSALPVDMDDNYIKTKNCRNVIIQDNNGNTRQQ